MTGYGTHGSSLRDLPRLRTSRRLRASSYDVTGGNADWVTIAPGQTCQLADIAGAGAIQHIWITVAPEGTDGLDEPDESFMRELVLRAFWDGASDPSVISPLGDFFGIGHGRTHNFSSLPLQMSPQDGKALNCFFQMPYSDGARFEVTNEGDATARFYYYIDYEQFDQLEPGLGRFHAWWNRSNPTPGTAQGERTNEEFLFGGQNTSGDNNYVILDVAGRGHYVGCTLNITNLRETEQWNWYGEGDDMIFIDGEPWPPKIHGTGTEDYFNTAWCPSQEYNSLFHGLTLPGGPNWSGQISTYRFHIEDPVTFTSSIRVTIEHGHNNQRSDDLSSVAYWYSEQPVPGLSIPSLDQRVPTQGPPAAGQG